MTKYNRKLVNRLIILVVCAGALLTYLYFAHSYDEYAYPRSYNDLVSRSSEQYNVPEYIIYAVIRTESSFIERAVSNKGAVGLMQLTPETFFWLQSKMNVEVPAEKLYDPGVNISYGTKLLSVLYSEFGDWETVYAAYNAGRTQVIEWLADPQVTVDGKLENIPFEETAKFVKKVSRAAKNYERIYY